MTYQVSRGKAYAGSIRGRKGGYGEFVLVNTVARTDTSAKTLGTLPQDAQIVGLTIWGAAASNAGTTATLSVGKSGGAGAEYLSAYDVKTAASGNGQTSPNAALLLAPTKATADTVVTGTYAETGTASTSGGPWTVIVRYVV